MEKDARRASVFARTAIFGLANALSARERRWRAAVVAAVVFLALGGAAAVWRLAIDETKRLRDEAMTAAAAVAGAIDTSLLSQLTASPADVGAPAYENLKQHLAAARAADADCRFLYFLGRRPNGEIFFYVDSEPPDSQDYSPPGQTYEEASAPTRAAFDERGVTISPPETDRWGTWVTTFVPIRTADGATAAVLGMDIDARDWTRDVLRTALKPIPSIALLITLIIAFYRAYVRVARHKRSLLSAQELLTAQRNTYQTYIESAPYGILVVTEAGMCVECNAAARWMFALPEGGESFPIGQLFAGAAAAEGLLTSAELLAAVDDSPEVLCRRTDGSTLWTSFRSVALGDDGQRLVFVADISARRLAEAAKVSAEKAFQAAANSAHDAMIMLDAKGRVSFWNHAAEKLFGHADYEAWGQDLHELIAPPEQLTAFRRAFPEFQRSGTGAAVSKTVDLVAVRNDGTRVSVELSLSAFELDGEWHAVGVLRDVTERRRMESEIKAAMAQWKQLFQFVPSAVFTVDLQGNVTSVNRKLLEITGFTEEELLGKPCFTFADTPCKMRCGLLSPDVPKPIADRDCTITTKSGQTRHIRKNADYILDASGAPIGGIESFIDVTERKQVEEQLERAQLETEAANLDLQRAIDAAKQMAALAEASNAAKSEFLANMSHEIRTPMNGVIGMLGLLMDTELTPEQRDFAATAQSSADALLVIINDILDFSKIEAGKLDLESVDFDLQTALEDFAELCAMRASEKGLEFVLSIPPDVPRALNGDPARLRQILVNLAGNAIKFTEQGEVSVEAVLIERHDNRVKLRFDVRDTGIGIPADKLGALFRPFTQADASTTRRFGGTGLGLSISKQLATLMGGDIGAKSVEGQGSLFWFTVILETRLAAPVAPPALESVRGSRVLVVDDNETNRRVLAGMLHNWGCRFDAASGADEAMALLLAAQRHRDPYLIALVDMHMPHKDGEQLGLEIRANPDLADKTRLIMLTSAGRRGDAQRMKEIGFSAYLTKPVKQSQLHDCLATVLYQEVPHPGASPDRLVTRHTLAEDARQRARILLAEDNPTNQKVALGVLRKLGYFADVAANGAEAVAAWLAQPYDLILMDVQMPEMDGYQATAAIRAEEAKGGRPRTAIVAMTAHAMKGDREKCLFAGMDDYVAKPIDPKELARALTERLPAVAPPPPPAETAAPPPVDNKDVFDPDALVNRLSGDRELANSILESFVGDVRQQLDALQTLCAGDDAPAIRRQAHAIKGAAANAGANALRVAAYAVEQSAADGDLAGARAKQAAVEEAFAALVVRLTELGILPSPAGENK